MMEILQNNIWQFVFGFLGIGITVIIFLLQRRKKSLSYQIISATPLLTIKEGNEKTKIKILFEEKSVQNVYLVILQILNDGNTPILPSDIQDNLKFYFGQSATILSAEVIDTSPKTFKPHVEIGTDHIDIRSTLFNSGDTVILKLLLDGYNKIECDARIVGVNEVKRVNGGFKLSGIYVLVGIIIFITGSVLLSVLINLWSFYTIASLLKDSRFTWQFILYSLLIIIGLTLAFWGVPMRLKDRTRD